MPLSALLDSYDPLAGLARPEGVHRNPCAEHPALGMHFANMCLGIPGPEFDRLADLAREALAESARKVPESPHIIAAMVRLAYRVQAPNDSSVAPALPPQVQAVQAASRNGALTPQVDDVHTEPPLSAAEALDLQAHAEPDEVPYWRQPYVQTNVQTPGHADPVRSEVVRPEPVADRTQAADRTDGERDWDALRARAAELRAAGVSFRKIAAELDVSTGFVQLAAKAASGA